MVRRTSTRKASEVQAEPRPREPMTPVRQQVRIQKKNRTINDEITGFKLTL